MEFRQISSGYLLQLDRREDFDHFVGGKHGIAERYSEEPLKGAICPNCEEPLIQYMGLDTSDARLGLEFLGVKTLCLFYCMRCEIQHGPFVYEVLSDEEISIVHYNANLANEEHDQPQQYLEYREYRESGLPDVMPRRSFVLQPCPDQLQDFAVRYVRQINRRYKRGSEEASPEEFREAARLAQLFTASGRPYFYPFNQVGGLGCVPEYDYFPVICKKCAIAGKEHEMAFLAMLGNSFSRSHDPELRRGELPRFFQQDLVLTYEGVHLTFFICPDCGAVQAQGLR